MTGPINPLDGKPLEEWQVLVTGSDETGPPGRPRQTVVDTRAGAYVPPWITVTPLPDGTALYVDNGQQGGTYDGTGAQTLPELTVTARRDWWPWLIAAAVGWLVLFGPRPRGAGSREW